MTLRMVKLKIFILLVIFAMFGNVNALAERLLADPLTQTITFGSLAPKTYGDAAFDLTATATSALDVTYASSNTSVATISGSTVTIVGAGSTTITASQSGDVNYVAATPVIQSLTVNPIPLTISGVTVSDKVYDGTTTATLSGGSLTGIINSDDVTLVLGTGTFDTKDVGPSKVVTAIGFSLSGVKSGNYILSGQPTGLSASITIAPQSITFNSLLTKTYGDTPFALTATASSTLPVTYASSNETVATISGSAVTIVGVGSTTITASQSGNSNYSAAPTVDQTLTVSKATPLISNFGNLSKNYGDASFALSASSTSTGTFTYSSSNLSVATVSGNTVTIVGSGTTTLTATQSSDNNYLGGSATATLTVGAVSQTITFGSLAPKTYGDAPFLLTATASSTLPVTYISSNTAVATISGSTVTIIGAGSTTITASQAGNSNYSAAATVDQTLTVSKATPLISNFGNLSKSYSDPTFTLSATSNSTGTFTYTSSNLSVATISGNTVTILGSGSTTLTATQSSDNNYLGGSATATLTVGAVSQTITFGSLAPKTYGDVAFPLTASASSSLPVAYISSNTAVATILGSTVTIVGAGSTTITASQSGNSNYSAAATVDQTLTVSKATPLISNFGNLSKSYGDPTFTLSATSNSTGTFTYTSSNLSVATISGNTVTILGSGSTTLTATQSLDNNYVGGSATATLNVGTIGQTITFGSLPVKTYGDAPFLLTATASSTLPVTYTSSNTAVATISGSTVTIIGAGSTTITASQAGNSNYSAAATVDQTLTVSKATPLISNFGNLSKSYSDPTFTLSATSNSTGTFTYTSSNLSVATISGNTVTILGSGSTTLTATQSLDNNYVGGSATATLNVGTIGQTITFGSLPVKTYGDAPFLLTATASSTLPVTYTSSNTAVATISGSTVTIIGAGSTTITASQAGNSNYSAAAVVQQTLTVSKTSTTILNFGNISKNYGDASFALSAISTSTGTFIFSSSNLSVATISGNTVTIVGAGTTTLTATQNADNNYLGATASATLSVGTSGQSITFGSLASKAYGDASFALTASASSTLPVSYVSSNTSVATISGSAVTIVGAGSAEITASQIGNTNYGAATPVKETLTVNRKPLTITGVSALNKVYDGTVAATLSTGSLSGIINSDNVTLSAGTAIFDTKDVGTGKTVAATGFLLTGSKVGNYILSAQPIGLTANITIAPQTIVFGSFPNKTFGDAPFALTASAGSGLPVTYSSSNTSVATISGNVVTIVGAGTAEITASQTGNTNYGTATPVKQLLTVNKHSQTITFGALPNITYGSPPFTVTATGGDSGNPVVFSSSNTSVASCTGTNGATIVLVGAGSCIIYADQAGNSNYNVAPQVGRVLNGLNAEQSITFAPLAGKTYGDLPFELSAVASSGLPITYSSSNTSVATISGTTLTIVGAGSTEITASQYGDVNYGAAVDVKQTLSISKKGVTIIGVVAVDKVYDGNTSTTLNNAALNGIVGTDNVNVTGGVGVFDTKDTGTQKPVSVTGFELTGTNVDNYFLAGQPTGLTANITAKSLTITGVSVLDKLYDGGTIGTLTGANLVGIIVQERVALAGGIAVFSDKNVGSVKELTISGYTLVGADVGNYVLVNQPVGLTANILPRPITIMATAKTKVYGDADPVLNAQITAGVIQATDVVSGSMSRVAGEPAGVYAINKGSYTYGSNYTETFVSANLTIAKRALTITADPKTKTYGDIDSPLTAQITSGLIITGDVANGLLNRTVGETPGTYTINKGTYSYGSNYEEIFVSDNFTIIKRSQTISFDALPSKTYLDPDFNLTATASSGLPVVYASSNTAVAKIFGNTVKVVGAGSTLITASQSGDANFSAASDVVQTLTVANIAPVTLTDPINNTAEPITACESTNLEFGYSGLTGSPTQYKITFSAAAIAAGIKNIDYTNMPLNSQNGSLSFAIPIGTPGGSYTGTLKFRNVYGVESSGYDFQFIVNVSASNIVKKFDDVVVCDNSANRFTAYQWYKNGVAIPGATKQFYSESGGLVGVYSVEVTTLDGQKLKTCEKVFNSPQLQQVKAYPNPLKMNQNLNVKIEGLDDTELKNAKLTIVDIGGNQVYRSEKVESLNLLSLILPSEGVYIGHIVTDTGTSLEFKVIVTK